MTVEQDERELGQATVELALVLPVVVVLLLVAVQVALVARDQLLVVHAARVAVREVSVNGPRTSPRGVVVRSVPLLKQNEVSTETSYQGGSPSMVIVSVRYRSQTDVPLVGRLFPKIVLEAKAAMRDESVQTRGGCARNTKKEAGAASSDVESCVSRAVGGYGSPQPD
jgi:hypothetical protein